MRRNHLVPAALLLVVSCSSATEATSATDATTPDPSSSIAPPAPADGSAVADGGGATTVDAGDPGPVRFHIQLDYRFDTHGFFADPVRRAALEGAARAWGRLLSDAFDDVPANTYVFLEDPEDPYGAGTSFTLEYAIDDLVVFVGSASLGGGQLALSGPSAGLSGVTDTKLRDSLDARYSSFPFRPWTGWLSFDTTTDFDFDPTPEKPHVVPSDKFDFYTVAMHELGHILGFGTSDAFKNRVSNGAFTGSNAEALHGGAPVPLASDERHVTNAVTSAGHRLLMNVSFPPGERYPVTPLDRAMLEDLGYHF